MSGEWWTWLADNHTAITGIFSIIVGIIVFGYKKVVMPMLNALKNYTKLCMRVDKIFEEVSPNGGTSIKDSVNRMEKDLSRVSGRQKAMAADSSLAEFETNALGDCVWVNRTYTRLVGRDISEMLGHGWQNVIAESDRKAVSIAWYNAVKEDREFTMSFNLETPDGTIIPAKVRSYKIASDSTGEILGYYGNIETL